MGTRYPVSTAKDSSMALKMKPFPDRSHDHDACVKKAVEVAQEICTRRNVRLTPLRQRVFELVWGSRRPVGAYDILGVLQTERGGAAPPTVYRALEFLLENALIHRIESSNSFVGCAKPGRDHAWQFLICRACGRVAEISDTDLDEAISAAAEIAGFTIQRRTIELGGLCAECHKAGED